MAAAHPGVVGVELRLANGGGGVRARPRCMAIRSNRAGASAGAASTGPYDANGLKRGSKRAPQRVQRRAHAAAEPARMAAAAGARE